MFKKDVKKEHLIIIILLMTIFFIFLRKIIDINISYNKAIDALNNNQINIASAEIDKVYQFNGNYRNTDKYRKEIKYLYLTEQGDFELNKKQYKNALDKYKEALKFKSSEEIKKKIEFAQIKLEEHNKKIEIERKANISKIKNICSSLSNIGLAASEYKFIEGYGYSCFTPYKMLDDFSNISFYAEGREYEIEKVYIVLNFNNLSDRELIIKYFLKACKIITLKMSSSQMTEEIKEAIATLKTGNRIIGNYSYTLEADNWKTNSGFTYKYTIQKM